MGIYRQPPNPFIGGTQPLAPWKLGPQTVSNVRSLSATQTIPDFTQTATATVIDNVNSTQTMPDFTQTAFVGGIPAFIGYRYKALDSILQHWYAPPAIVRLTPPLGV